MIKDKILYNNLIKVDELRVIFESENLGILPINQAMEIAQSKELDLVLISSVPPVGKICDLGKYKYDLIKKQKVQKKNNKPIVVKQIALRPNISSNDLATKCKSINGFLNDNDRVLLKLKLKKKELMNEKIVEKSMEFMKNLIHNQLKCTIINDVTQDKSTISAQISPAKITSSSKAKSNSTINTSENEN